MSFGSKYEQYITSLFYPLGASSVFFAYKNVKNECPKSGRFAGISLLAMTSIQAYECYRIGTYKTYDAIEAGWKSQMNRLILFGSSSATSAFVGIMEVTEATTVLSNAVFATSMISFVTIAGMSLALLLKEELIGSFAIDYDKIRRLEKDANIKE